MSIQSLSPSKTVCLGVMLILVLVIQQPALSLSTDQEQPIEIEANTGELDDIKNINIYTGNVIVTQGSIRITGDRMTVNYTEENDIDTLVMEGNPATYRQLPDDSTKYDEAKAMRMEYHERKNLLVLIDKARVTQAQASFSGDRIEYDSALSKVKVTSGPAIEGQERERVKIIIPPKTE